MRKLNQFWTVVAAATAAASLAGAAGAQDALPAGDAASSAPTPAPAAAAPAVVKPADKVICRSVRSTGTRMPERICETVAERERRLEEVKNRRAKASTNGQPQNRTLDGLNP